MKIYISGRISGLDPDIVDKKFLNSWRRMMIEGKYIPVESLKIKPLFGIKKWLFYMIADIHQLLKCDAILLQPDWIDSKGSRIEVIVAILTRKQIIIEK